jgi:hypothetical protein
MIEQWLLHMKPISAYIGDPKEKVEEKRAWWFRRTGSGKRIWPGQKYVIIKRYFDDTGRPPIHGLSWDRIYTPKEYTVYLLTRDSKKKIEPIGQEYTGNPYSKGSGY